MDDRKVREKAKQLGVKVKNVSIDTVIRGIQIAEGNMPCFRSGVPQCRYGDCCWREDCLAAAK